MISKGAGDIESPVQTENYFGLISETQFQFGWASPPQNYNVHYRYDDFGRLITADNSIGTQWDIGVGANNLTTYDQNGNVTKMVVGSTPKYYIYHTNSNKVKNVNGSGSMHYQYDLNGNLKSNTLKNLTLSYDPFTQMTTQVSSPTATVNFEYDSNNERLLKKENSGSSTLYLRGMNSYPLYEKQSTQGDGSFDKIYIYGPTGLIAVKRMEGTYFVMKDHLGSTRVILNGATGEPVNYFDFTPYGNTMRVGGGVSVKYQFTGQEYDDELGLHNFRARLYDSDIGIFYATDPAGQGFSPYSYAGNNPVIYVDKDGRFWWIVAAVAGAWLSGSIANDFEFNPIKWDWKDPGTYLWTIGGALGGWATFESIAAANLNFGFGAKLLSATGKEIAALGVTLSNFGTSAMYLSGVSAGLYGAYVSYNRIKSMTENFPGLKLGSDDLINDPTERNLVTFSISGQAAALIGLNSDIGLVLDWNTGEFLPYAKWGFSGALGYSYGPKVGYMKYSFKDFYGRGHEFQLMNYYNSSEFAVSSPFVGMSLYSDSFTNGFGEFGGSISFLSRGLYIGQNYTSQTIMGLNDFENLLFDFYLWINLYMR